MTSPTPGAAFDPRRALGRPLVAYFDKRFQDVHDRIRQLYDRVDDQFEQLSGRVDDQFTQLYGRVATEVETISEMTLGMQRFFDISARQVDDLLDRMSVLDGSGSRQAGDPDGAQLVESAFAVAAAGARRGLRVLHIGSDGADPGVPLALASLGCRVTAIGPRREPGHPNLVWVEGSIDTWGGGDTLFDRILWLPSQGDRRLVDLLAKCLDVDGELVASIRSTGEPAGAGLQSHLDDWSVLEHRVLARHDGSTWVAVDDPGSAAVSPGPAVTSTVALLRATPRT